MHLDNQSIRPCRYRPQGYRRHQTAFSRGMRGIGKDGQMRKLLYGRDSVEIEGVASIGLKGANASLAQDDLVVALACDVLCGLQPLLNGASPAAFQHNRLARVAHLAQK